MYVYNFPSIQSIKQCANHDFNNLFHNLSYIEYDSQIILTDINCIEQMDLCQQS
jgi:hypothetical protein